MIEQKTIDRYLTFVEECLVERYACSEEEAKKRMEESHFKESIIEDTETVFGNTPTYWARKLLEEKNISCELTHS